MFSFFNKIFFFFDQDFRTLTFQNNDEKFLFGKTETKRLTKLTK